MSRAIFGRLLTDVRGRRSTWSAEVRGGVATFLTMAYILPVNAGILSNADYIQRLYTSGGVAPTRACTDGETAAVPYGALYVFWG